MSSCSNLATKPEVEVVKSQIDNKIDKTEKAGIINNAANIAGAALSGGIALANSRASQALNVSNQLIGSTSQAIANGRAAIAASRTAQATAQAAQAATAVATRQALIAKGTAIAADAAARRATFEAIYQGSRASQAINAASGAASVAGRALSMVLGVFNIIGTLATVAFVATLAFRLEQVVRRVTGIERDVGRLQFELATANAVINALQQQVYQADFKASAATTRANTAIEKANELIEISNATAVRANEAIEKANLADQKATEAINKANAVTAQVNLASTKSDQALSLGNTNQAQIASLVATTGVLSQQNQYLTRQTESLKADVIGARIGIENLSNRLNGTDLEVRAVKESTITNASGIRDLNGELVGLKQRILVNQGDSVTKSYVDNADRIAQAAIAEVKATRPTIKEASIKIRADIFGENSIDPEVREFAQNRTDTPPPKDGLTESQVKTLVETEVNSRVEDYEQLNEQQTTNINNKIDALNVPTVAQIALAVAGLDIIRQIRNNSQRATCQAPSLVPPVGAQAKTNGAAIATLQGVTVAQNAAIKSVVETNKQVLTNPLYGLQTAQKFAETAWKATKADKIVNALNVALAIHNAMMLSNNLGQTISEALNVSLNALGIRDEKDTPIDIGAAVREKVQGVLTGLLGAEAYKALTTRIASANRIYQSSANLLNITRDLFDSAQSIAQETCENTGKIGNALLEAGTVFEDAYPTMTEQANPSNRALRKIRGLTERIDDVENGFSAISSISSELVEAQENFNQLQEGQQAWRTEVTEAIKAIDDQKTETKEDSVTKTDVDKADFGKNEKYII